MNDTTSFILQLGTEWARKHGTPLILASTTGATAEKMLNLIQNDGIRLIVASHEGPWAPSMWRFSPDVRKKLEKAGYPLLSHQTVLFVRMALWLGKYFGIKFQGKRQAIFEEFIGTGGWVCFKIVRRAVQAGLIRLGETVVAIGGKISGADTALALKVTQTHPLRVSLIEAIAHPS
ncbi:MAG: hypothetical protein HY447_03665 [Candidatus Omnitrophica bacterium]|nr:hypothetical protein [Candidatus Omnitrophota bacterium]